MINRPEADPFNLQRFVNAQQGVVEQALAEISAGQKRSHWMWFIFPQIAGLGSSPMARRFAISSPDAARAFLQHPLLGQRLRQCVLEALNLRDRQAIDIFGATDAMKLRSSLTLFAAVSPAGSEFHRALDHFFAGQADEQTLQALAKSSEGVSLTLHPCR